MIIVKSGMNIDVQSGPNMDESGMNNAISACADSLSISQEAVRSEITFAVLQCN